MYIIWNNQRKALNAGLISKPQSGRTLLQSIEYYFWEFDGKGLYQSIKCIANICKVVGLLLIVAGISLILLPFSLAAYQTKGWASGMIIAMLVIGFLCLIVFPLWEKFFSKKCFIPFELLSDRTIVGACLLAGFLDISF